MFIKKVIINGFKAYADSVSFGPFSPGKNCILGLNGSGKTTLFQAIEFVLLESHAILPVKSRTNLLHNGTTQKNRAFVEIHFDNSKKIFPIEAQEFSIRREIGIQKDEYFINRKHSSRNDVVALFNSANISLQNETFIIKQNKVKSVAEMSDEDRLCLLYDISGIQVYSDKRQESVKLIAEADERRKKIGESIEYIEYRIEQLEKEKEELEQFHQLDKERKALEYIVYDRQIKEAETQLQSINDIRSNQSTVLEELRNNYDEVSNSINTINTSIERSNTSQISMQSSINSMSESRQKILTKIENFGLKVESLKAKLAKSNEEQHNIPEEIKALKQKIEESERKKNEMKEDLLNKKSEIGELSAKIFKGSNDIKKKVNQLKFQVEANEKHIHEINQKISKNKSEIVEIEKQILEEKKKHQTKMEEVEAAKAVKYDALNARKQFWHEESSTQKKLQIAMKSFNEYKQKYAQRMENMDGINIAKSSGIEGIHGPLIDLISLKDSEENWGDIAPAIDAVGGRRLFCMIAEDDEKAKKLNQILSNGQHGSVQIMVLNRLRVSTKEIPTTGQMRPLMSFISIDDKFKKAAELIFGSYGLCPTLDAAIDESETNKVNTVTVGGDINIYNGVMKGGYRNPLHSAPILHFNLMKLEKELKNIQNELNIYQEKISDAENNISEASKHQNEAENAASEIKDRIAALKMKSEELKLQNSQYKADLDSKKAKHIVLQSDLAQAKGELNSEYSEANEQEIAEISEKLALLSGESTDLQLKIGSMDSHIESIKDKIEKLQSQIVDVSDVTKQIDKYLFDIESMKSQEEDLKMKIEETVDKVTNEKEEINIKQKELSDLLKQQQDLKRKIRHQQNAFENLNTQATIQSRIIADSTERKNFIVPVPEEEIEKYSDHSNTRIHEILSSINSELQLYRHVNKKADEQTNRFQVHRDDLKRQISESDENRASLISLISELDNKKQTAFEAFFAKLSLHFKNIYHTLEPSRNAQLVLQRESSNSDEPTALKGVAIRFDDFFMEQLSGGQKTVCAVAFLMAIQKTTPMPFYLFDEIDADLDPQHRKNIANIINEFSMPEDGTEPSQFIFSTFKPELVEISDKFFGIKSQNDKSVVEELRLEDAIEFISNDQPNEPIIDDNNSP